MEGVYKSKAVMHIQGNQGTEMTKVISGVTSISCSKVHVILVENIASAIPRIPSCHLLEDNQKARQEFLRVCVPLTKAALRGDWETARFFIEQDPSILTASITKGRHTVLHLAAGSGCAHFVAQLVGMMNRVDLELQDLKGNTALCFAAAKGDVQVAEILLAKNKVLATIRGGQGMTPLYMAVLFGRSEMASLLYPLTEECFDDKDRIGTFFTCIDTGLYDLALKILKDDMSLAVARNKDGKTALHLLAQTPSAFANENSKGWSKLIQSIMPGLNFKLKRKHSQQTNALELVRCLWKHVLNIGHDYTMEHISHPSELLFDATKLGNFEFIAELISSYPDLVWATDSQNRSIIHVAVLNRHANIFNLIHDIGPIKDILATYEDDKENNILHLAAQLPPLERLNIVSGAALQMQQELLWFEEVKKIAQPLYTKEKNKKRQKPKELFTIQHKRLLREGESWMKSTANSCMIVSTLIATVVFAAAFSLPGGNNNSGTPNNLQYTSFLIFVLSDGLALFSSVVAILMFLSILTSRYAEDDFLKSLPLKLMIGLASLFFSMITMMIAFSFTFVIAYHHYGLKWVPFLISIFAFLPVVVFAALQFPLLFDTFSSTYWSRALFQPNRHMLY